ncbi:MAG: alpha/beta hydrolase [Beijerinckiaceae bacterium]
MTIHHEAEYNNRARVKDALQLVEGYLRDSAAYRKAFGARMRQLRYGQGPRHIIDVFAPAETASGAAGVLFIHGGYWQAFDASAFSHMARGLNLRGITVGIASYDLCPDVALSDIIKQMRQATKAFAVDQGGDVVVTGHSAGGHLAACMASSPPASGEETPIKAGLAISGLFELEPLLPTSINQKLRLTAASARANSPRMWLPTPGLEFDCWVGADESAEYLRQSRGLASVWGAMGVETRYEEIAGGNHFTAIAGLADEGSLLTARVSELAGGG